MNKEKKTRGAAEFACALAAGAIRHQVLISFAHFAGLSHMFLPITPSARRPSGAGYQPILEFADYRAVII